MQESFNLPPDAFNPTKVRLVQNKRATEPFY